MKRRSPGRHVCPGADAASPGRPAGDRQREPGQLFEQVRQGLQELQLLQQQLEQVMAVYNSLSHVTDLASAVGVLQTLGIQNPLPVNIGSVQGLLAGTGSPQGMLGSIGSLFNTNFDANHVYTPTGDSFEATLLQRNATASPVSRHSSARPISPCPTASAP